MAGSGTKTVSGGMNVVEEDQLPMEFELSGLKGMEKKSVVKRSSGMAFFLEFLNVKKLPFESLPEIEESLIREFGTFLKTYAVKHYKDGSNEPLKPSSGRQYIGAVRTELRHDDRFKHQKIWENDALFASVSKDVDKHLSRIRIYKGLSVQDRSKPIGRYLLDQICGHLVQENKADSYKMRCVFVTLFSAVGRSSEVALLSMNTMFWDMDLEVLVCDWSEIKNPRQKLMTFHAGKSCHLQNGLMI